MSPHRVSVQDMLAYELKKELADRYFGFRKLIEEDKLDFAEKARQYSQILEKRIAYDLIRICLLLRQEALIEEFFSLTGLPAYLFYDPYLSQSARIRARVFTGVHLHGLTGAGRFKNLLFDCYERLEHHLAQYREKFTELLAYEKEINAEIDLFQRSNDLGAIMGFLKSLGDRNRAGSMEGGLEPGLAAGLAARLRIEPQPPVEHYLPLLPPLPALESIRPRLKALAESAWQRHGEEVLRELAELAASEEKREAEREGGDDGDNNQGEPG